MEEGVASTAAPGSSTHSASGCSRLRARRVVGGKKERGLS